MRVALQSAIPLTLQIPPSTHSANSTSFTSFTSRIPFPFIHHVSNLRFSHLSIVQFNSLVYNQLTDSPQLFEDLLLTVQHSSPNSHFRPHLLPTAPIPPLSPHPESLCRASLLHNFLQQSSEFYKETETPKSPRDWLYNDQILLVEHVPFIRNENGDLLEKPFVGSVRHQMRDSGERKSG
jgi:hypothetical protein